eukprot:Phypoly_transcript_05622.p1 GENE.Phypoly_transcript_05622~~Phypoly_transcript_05622.p1  ORF type:complete len:327 (+),score=42.47 Phypoly_transcript_05622:744-1724(+)
MNVKSSQSVVKCGDVVTLNVHFNNSSGRNLTGVRVKLKQVWECTGVFYHKNIVLKYLSREGFPASRGPHNAVVQIKIPHRLQTCPTVTNASRFKCTYYLAVFGVTKMPGGIVTSDTVKCRVPITISNLPSADHENESSSSTLPLPSLENSSDSDSDSDSGSESEPAYPRGLAQTASESSLRPVTARSLTSTRSLSALSAANASAEANASNSVFDFLSNYSSRSQAERDSQGNFTRPNGEDDYGLGALFDEESHKDKKGKGADEHHNTDDEPTKECVICYDGQKNMLLLPCAHIATCVSCTSYIMHSNKMCPVCRTKISQVMRIYPV